MAETGKSFKEKFISGVFWLSTGTFVSQSISWISTILVIRLLSPSDYGLMAMAMSLVGIIAPFSELGMGSSIVQAENIKESDVGKLFGFSITISFFGWLICLVASPLIASFYNEPKLISIIRILSLNLLLISLYVVPQALLVREINFKAKSIIDGISLVGSSILTLILAVFGMGVWSIVIGLNGLHVFKLVLFNYVRPGHLKPIFNFTGSGKFIAFGMNVTGSRILFSIYNQSDAIIIGKMMGDKLLGIYNVALNLATIPISKTMPIINQITFASFSRIQDDMGRLRQYVLRATRSIAIPSFPIFFGMASVAPEGIPLILGSKWGSVVVPFQLLCFVIPLRSISPILNTTINAVGKPGVHMTNNIITTVIMIIGFLIGATYGLYGVCIAWIIAYPLSFLITSWRSLRVLGISLRYYLNATYFPLFTSFLMFVTISILRKQFLSIQPLIALTIYVIVGVMFYTSAIILFRKEEYLKLKLLISETICTYVWRS